MEKISVPETGTSRRTVLAVAAATISLPMLEAAVGNLRTARAAAGAAPAAKPSWISTKLKPDDVKDNQFTAVAGQKIVLSRKGKEILAMSNVCTHRGTAIAPKSNQSTLTCPSHGSIFAADGSVSKGPATKPLPRYALRLNSEGVIEVDPSQAIAKDAKEATLTLS